MTVADTQKVDPYAHIGLPPRGIRNYWYPALATWRVGRKPRAIKLLGEEIVIYRDGAQLYALQDRCAHRGARLSMGKCLYPGSGTISCPYHGWTYKGETGRCVAKLVEGPDAPITPKAKVKTYPVREFAGVIWVFVGDMDAVELEEDLPVYLSNQAEWHTIWNWRTYRCDWRLLSDNLSHDQHAPFLHRTSPELVLKPIFPHATRNVATPLEDGKSVGHRTHDGITSAEYPGLGRFPPKQEWYRMLKATGRGVELDPLNSPAAKNYGIRHRHISMLPSINLIGRPSGDFFTCRWITPVDEQTTILWNFNLFRKRGKLGVVKDWIGWLFWKSWAHDWLFSDQDKWIVERVTPGPELLSRTDVSVTAWRRFAIANARKPPDAQDIPKSEYRKDSAVA
ncbi:MAG TPA: Rieske 2Fe-2S domain-containing protein [Burkholderiales bacterium]|nr:Rieske 2Fe-2S domain-containing protein [Burkholderiales bacterium]